MNADVSETETFRLSVVIPTLNEAALIEESVQRALVLQPIDVVVADGQSADETVDLAAAAGATVVSCQPGRGAQLNAGAAATHGDVLLFLHADCWLEPQAVEQMKAALSDPQIAGGAFRQRIDHDGRIFRWLEWGNAARVRWRSMAYGDQGIFIRRSVFKEAGRFPEVRLMEDVLLMTELRRRGLPIRLLDGPLHVDPRRWLKHGVVRQTLRNWSLLAGLRLGISPNRLANFYRHHRRHKEI
jgi:rSAM/selenodomain-associated transferase 2